MATSTGSTSSCSVFDKQYYITAVTMILPTLFSPTQSMPGEAPGDLAPLIHPDAKFYEFPHMLTPEGRKDYLTAYRASTEPLNEFFKDAKYEVMGEMVVIVSPRPRPTTNSSRASSQSYGAIGKTVTANVAVELIWTATVAKDCGGQLREGVQMTTMIAVFFDFHNGQLVEQRNYNCVVTPSVPREPRRPEGENEKSQDNRVNWMAREMKEGLISVTSTRRLGLCLW
ncbi:hypothetical protein AYL99_00561 [Fonsecaea erecta]|uniref:SnoaL-like domain-containing protein n=1 Tax=Fonsecaea erecta TaxID=1367422 RepID=A0A178ZXP7_9EURO|nr:hypothetical protein AYL99_00561 [Fonsecaea erecta]OAP64589.1 hypothetical protein AYL99_00561 [Fonsecaea erecta]